MYDSASLPLQARRLPGGALQSRLYLPKPYYGRAEDAMSKALRHTKGSKVPDRTLLLYVAEHRIQSEMDTAGLLSCTCAVRSG